MAVARRHSPLAKTVPRKWRLEGFIEKQSKAQSRYHQYDYPSIATRPRSLISFYERIQIRRSSDQYLLITILKARLGLFIPPALPVSRRPLPSTIFNFLTLRSPYNNGDIDTKAVLVPVSNVLHIILIYVPSCKRTSFLCLSYRAATRHMLKT